MNCIGEKRIIIFGVGGVGSWCAESLVRSGIKHLTIIDSDRVCITNINRHLRLYAGRISYPGCRALNSIYHNTKPLLILLLDILVYPLVELRGLLTCAVVPADGLDDGLRLTENLCLNGFYLL